MSLPSLDIVTDEDELVGAKEPVGMALSPIPSTPSDTVSERVGGTVSERVGGTVNERVGGTVSERVGGTVSERVGGTVSERVGGTVSERVGATVNERVGATVNDGGNNNMNDNGNTTANETPVLTGEKTLPGAEGPSDWHSVFVNPPLHRVLFRSIANGINNLINNVNAAERHPAITNYSAIPFGDAESEDYDRIMKRVSVGVGAGSEK